MTGSIETLMQDDLIGRVAGRSYASDYPPCSEQSILDRCGGHHNGACFHADKRNGVIDKRYVEQCPTCKYSRWMTSPVEVDTIPGLIDLSLQNLTESQAPSGWARPNKDDYAFGLCEQVRRRSTCPRASCGTVLMDRYGRVISTGYNGRKRGESHCVDVGCLVFANHDILADHSEHNACWQFWEMYCQLRGWDPNAEDWTDFLSTLDVQAYVVAPVPICTACARTLWDVGIRKEPKWRQA